MKALVALLVLSCLPALASHTDEVLRSYENHARVRVVSMSSTDMLREHGVTIDRIGFRTDEGSECELRSEAKDRSLVRCDNEQSAFWDGTQWQPTEF